MSFLGSVGGVGRASTVLLRHKLISATGATAAAVIVAGCVFAATSAQASGQEKLASAGDGKKSARPAAMGDVFDAPYPPILCLNLENRWPL